MKFLQVIINMSDTTTLSTVVNIEDSVDNPVFQDILRQAKLNVDSSMQQLNEDYASLSELFDYTIEGTLPLFNCGCGGGNCVCW